MNLPNSWKNYFSSLSLADERNRRLTDVRDLLRHGKSPDEAVTDMVNDPDAVILYRAPDDNMKILFQHNQFTGSWLEADRSSFFVSHSGAGAQAGLYEVDRTTLFKDVTFNAPTATSLIQLISQGSHTELGRAVGQLGTGAFFFACRSCEYLTVAGKRRTKLLCVRNIRFLRNKRELSHTDPDLLNADRVSVTFEYQKNDQRNDTVTHRRTGDLLLCPVRSWATIVQRILSYPGTDADSPVNTVLVDNKLRSIPAATMLSALRRAVGILGKDRLGYAPSEIGTHSLRSGAAMCMYLHDVPVFTIMIIGRWSSDAFLRYIRKQVQEFSDGVSVRMIRGAGRDFFHIPNFALARREDPRTPNNPSNFASRQFGRDAQRHAQRPAFAVFN